MANNFMSQQFSVPNTQMGQLEPISDKLDSTIQRGGMGSVPNNPVSQQITSSNMQFSSYDPGAQRLSISNEQMGHIGSQQFVMPNKQLGEMGIMLNNAGLQHLSTQNKRKAPMESMSNSRAPQQLSMPNKRVAQMEHRPWLQQMSAPNKKAVQIQPMPKTPGSLRLPAPIKRIVQLDSVPSKSGSQQSLTPKSQTTQMQSAKARTESFESVRSKMRESLAAALALASQQQEKSLNTEKNSQIEAANSPKEKMENSQPAGPVSTAAPTDNHASSEEPKETVPSIEDFSEQKNIACHGASEEICTSKDIGNPSQVSSGVQELQPIILVDEDVSFSDSFFAKDELLQGNGLTWVLDPDKVAAEKKEITTPEKEKLDHVELEEVTEEQSVQSPQDLAFRIEAELFKLFGGVNKKYKERGRSLLFNLKDRNNPELRERVTSGQITPERLCSMTAEELASKELSEWRIAKAEELAQMVVLQDSDVDVRRLVKKTHKGEFQVEVEQDDGISVEVSVGANSLSRTLSQTKETETHSPAKPTETEDHVNTAGEKSNLQDDGNQGTITIPSIEGTDLMQGLMADDEVKDTDLPPIVSLDEFMQSLDSEPPFENLKVDAGKMTPVQDKDELESGFASKSSSLSLKDRIDTAADKPEKVDEKLNADLKSGDSTFLVGLPKGEYVWKGSLQLNITSTVSVVGYFKSSEKASGKEWPSFLEIKGRVRLNAFEKFLQELQNSRSRAIMVVHFASKEGCPESELVSIREVADSYVLEERVGFAEPAPGVELYFCPPHAKTVEMLSKQLPKDHTEGLNAVDNGLIGVIVWRKGQLTSTISPNSSSHHKHNSKKQHHASRRQQEKNPNLNARLPPSQGHLPTNTKVPPNDDEDDDVPPGFGPGAAREEDDLPEFNFSTQNPSKGAGMPAFHPPGHTAPRPVEHIRELIHKYGQTNDSGNPGILPDKRGLGARVQRWNDDDDDDDIPEWQPQIPQNQLPPVEPVHSLLHQLLRSHTVQHHQSHLGLAPHQPMLPLTTSVAMPMQSVQVQPPMNVMQGSQNAPTGQQGSWWVSQSGSHALPNSGQFYAVPGQTPQPGLGLRHDPTRRRDF